MSLPRSSSSTGGVSASRSVALDLMLQTFMNSSEFHSSRPRVWENVSRLVPGTTPQQCYERWEEMRTFASHSQNKDCSELTAYGRPVSQKNHSHPRQQQTNRNSKFFVTSPPPPLPPSPPHFPSSTTSSSSLSRPLQPHVSHQRLHVEEGEEEKQLIPNKKKEREKEEKEEVNYKAGVYGNRNRLNNKRENGEERRDNDKSSVRVQSSDGKINVEKPQSKRESDTIIHVFDDHRKSKREFHCPRAVLVREMRYFSEYLMSEAELWDEIDISVHCDISVFDWLMRYAKRGLLEGTRGEILEEPLEPPDLETTNVVSILISSDFLKMDSLVEKCLDYCHENLSVVVASPANMGCISNLLRERLAAKFTPDELEAVVDKKDKIRSKLFAYHIQQLFWSTFSHPTCPANASTLFKCKHCGRLLTLEQSTFLSCSSTRLEVSVEGQLVWSHERDNDWNISNYLSSLRWQQNLSPRDIYWRLWGIVNWLRCSTCGQMFQCRDLGSCHHHLQPAHSGHTSTGSPVYTCCGDISTNLSSVPPIQTGRRVSDHTVNEADSSFLLFSLLLSHRDTIICSNSESVAKEEREVTKPPSSVDETQISFLQNADTYWSQRTGSLKTSDSANLKQKGEGREEEGGDEEVKESRTRGGGGIAAGKEKGRTTSGGTMKATATVPQRLRRHRTPSEVSEMEEDEEEEEVVRVERRPHTQHPSASGGSLARQGYKRDTSRQTGHRSSSVRRRHSSSVPAQTVTVEDHVWDCTKSQRWNLDRQRENDERRLSLLFDRLVLHSPSSSPTNPTHTKPTNQEPSTFSGGIFSKLEAQFRAQQLANRAQQQPPSSKIPGRKR